MSKTKINNIKEDELGIKNINPENIKFLNCLANDSYAYIGLDNTFIVFNSINNIMNLIYTNESKSIISYNLITNKKINEIKNAHEYYIINLRYYQDIFNKSDLIISISCYDNNIKLWNIRNFECLLSFKNEDNQCDSLACFLNDNNQNYIVSINNSFKYKLDVINFKGELIKEIKDYYNNRTFIIDTYYDNKLSKNFIITGNEGFVKSYDYNENKIYKKYYDEDKRGHHSIIINNDNEIIQLIESSFDGNIRIWDFHSGILLKKIKVSFGLNSGWLYTVCLLNKNYLFVGCFSGILRIIDIKKGIVIKELKNHNTPVICIKKIYIPNFGESLISQGFHKDGINLWVNED